MLSGNSDINIYPYQSEMTPAILKLLLTTLGEAPNRRKTAEFWDWKHETNPFGQSYGLYAWSETQKEAVGLRILMRWSFKTAEGQSILATRAVDTATHPNYQRRGIFSTLTGQALSDLKQRGVHFIFNTPNQNSLPGYLKLGWQIVEKWPFFIRILRPLPFFLAPFRRKAVTPPPIQFEQYFDRGIMSWASFASRYKQDIPAVISAWETNRKQVGIRTPRNLDYLQWRYGQYPHAQYGIYALEKANQLAGFAILRPNLRYGLREIVLAELFLNDFSLESGKSFLKNLFKQLKGDYLIAHFTENTLEQELVKQTGFIKAPLKRMTFTVCPLNPLPHGADPLAPTTWDLSLGDLEIF